MASTSLKEAEVMTQKAMEEHEKFVEMKKQVNSKKAVKMIADRNLRNMWQGWRNVISYLK